MNRDELINHIKEETSLIIMYLRDAAPNTASTILNRLNDTMIAWRDEYNEALNKKLQEGDFK